MVSSFYRHGNTKIGFPIPFTPKNVCTPTPFTNNLNTVNLNKINEVLEANNNNYGKEAIITNNSNLKKFDKIINELKNNIEVNAVKFDKQSNNLGLDLNLIGENNDISKQYLELESNKRKFMVSPNSPFVPHVRSARNKN